MTPNRLLISRFDTPRKRRAEIRKIAATLATGDSWLKNGFRICIDHPYRPWNELLAEKAQRLAVRLAKG